MRKALALMGVVVAPIYLALPVILAPKIAWVLLGALAVVFGLAATLPAGMGATSFILGMFAFGAQLGFRQIPITGIPAIDAALSIF